jgi:hypothetical protein
MPAMGADVHVGINVAVPAPPTIVFDSPPRLVVVPEAPQVLYAPDIQVSFFSYGGRYYSYDAGIGSWLPRRAVHGPMSSGARCRARSCSSVALLFWRPWPRWWAITTMVATRVITRAAESTITTTVIVTDTVTDTTTTDATPTR